MIDTLEILNRNRLRGFLCAVVMVFGWTTAADAQLAPSIGYMHPSGGQAGQTIEVTLGGYDWTPDMQVFVHDPRIKLEILAPPGPVIVPKPPYWFGKKARRGPFLLPREIRAKLTIPANVPPGIVRWQVANANGASIAGRFVVGKIPELLELDGRKAPQAIKTLPITVSGQIKKIEEVDRYEFTAAKSGPITCLLVEKAIGSPLNAAVEIRDENGRIVVDAADTSGDDLAFTFSAVAGRVYSVSVYDVDFRGNRAYTYRLSFISGPRVVSTVPAAGQRGKQQSMKFIGYGVATGAAKLESVTRAVTFPTDKKAESFTYRLETPHGVAPVFSLKLSDQPETVAPQKPGKLTIPIAITGTLEKRYGEDRYTVTGKKGDDWEIALEAAGIGSPLDVSLALVDSTGKEVARNDDFGGTTDAKLTYTVPADGDYTISVTDTAGQSGTVASTYRLTVGMAQQGFTVTTPEFVAVVIGGTGKLALKATLPPGFKTPISVAFEGLPAGVTAPADLAFPAGRPALSVTLTVAADAASTASLVKLVATAKTEEQTLRFVSQPILVAVTIKPPFSIDAEGKDDVTKWPRGTIFPAPVLIERDEGFQEVIRLEMTSKQGRHRQGIRGPEFDVPNGVTRILYPVTLPEWLETTRTSRMTVNGVAKVTDPKGNVRYSLVKQKTRMGFLPGGALMKLAAGVTELEAVPGDPITVPLTISRSRELTGPTQLELRAADGSVFNAETVMLPATDRKTEFRVTTVSVEGLSGERELTIRATTMQKGDLPVVSETKVLVNFAAAKP